MKKYKALVLVLIAKVKIPSMFENNQFFELSEHEYIRQ